MATYSNAELLNELSTIFRARIVPSRQGGNLNTRDEYEQLIDFAALTFLLYQDSIFYVAQLADNKLQAMVSREVDYIEDMLVALDDLSQIGQPVSDTTTLSNAKTTVLALDAAQSISGRPETARFSRQMDAYAAKLYNNVISRQTQDFAHPKEEARTILKKNLDSLKVVHQDMLTAVADLRDLFTTFNALDIPSRASATALQGVRQNLDSIISFTESATAAQNLEASRRTLLKILANKTAVSIIGAFSDPSRVKYRSPVDPMPKGLDYQGRVAGSSTVDDQGGLSGDVGSAAQIETPSGPWQTPMSAALVLSMNGNAPVSIPLNTILGSLLVGRNSQSFPLDSTAHHLYVIVDPKIYTMQASGGYGVSSCVATLPANTAFGFKHLGAPLLLGGDRSGNDLYPRVITDLTSKATGTVASYTPATGLLQATTGMFNSQMVGGYVKNSSNERREILQFINSTTVVIDDYDANLTFPGNSLTACAVYGSDTTVSLSWSPALGTVPTANTTLSVYPSKKIAYLPASASTAQQVVDSINNPGNDDPAMGYWALRRYVKAMVSPTDPTKVALCLRSQCRSYMVRYLQITDTIFRPSVAAPGAPTTYSSSAHGVLGFRLAETPTPEHPYTRGYLSPEAVASIINNYCQSSGGRAEVNESIVLETTINLTPNSAAITDSEGLSFEARGVQQGDMVEILEGAAAGLYPMVYPDGPEIILAIDYTFPYPIAAAESGVRCRIIRKTVLIYSTIIGASSAIQVVSSPAVFMFTAGTTYGTLRAFEAVDRQGNLLEFTNAAAGDLLRVLGYDDTYEISSVQDGTRLLLESGVPANFSSVGFEVIGSAASKYQALYDRLVTFTSSPTLLKLDQLDQGVAQIEYAVVAALLPGQNFESSRNQARRFLVDLLSILTSAPKRTSEYSATVPVAVDNLVSILGSYSVSRIDAFDMLLEAFLDRKYERAVDLLTSGKLKDFFETNDETASYAGQLLAAARTVVNDLPRISSTMSAVSDEHNLATSVTTGENPDEDFTDADNQGINE